MYPEEPLSLSEVTGVNLKKPEEEACLQEEEKGPQIEEKCRRGRQGGRSKGPPTDDIG